MQGSCFQTEDVPRQMKASNLTSPVVKDSVGSDNAADDLVEEVCGLAFAEYFLAFDHRSWCSGYLRIVRVAGRRGTPIAPEARRRYLVTKWSKQMTKIVYQ